MDLMLRISSVARDRTQVALTAKDIKKLEQYVTPNAYVFVGSLKKLFISVIRKNDIKNKYTVQKM